jgi:hypothetical protein
LHPLPLRDREYTPVTVRAAASRHFVLDPYPFSEPTLRFRFPARHVEGKLFSSATELQERFRAAPPQTLWVTVTAESGDANR